MKCRGFTLIELMIVVAIIGIAAITIPAYQDYRCKKDGRSDCKQKIVAQDKDKKDNGKKESHYEIIKP